MAERSYYWLLCTLAITAVAAQKAVAQPTSPASNVPKIGESTVGDVLEQMGAKLELGVGVKELDNYSIHFDRMDLNRDGKHSREEYVEKGRYMTPQARAGIFQAADGNADGVVTKAEYVLNRIITDEGKAIVQRMDKDEDGLVERTEFVEHATKLLSDRELAAQVFAALDANADGGIPIPEYLRVWGRWARVGRKPAEERIATRRAEFADVTNEPVRTPPKSGAEGLIAGPRFGRPGAGTGPPSVNEVFDRFDGNNDGQLQKNEIPEFAQQFILPADADSDDVVTMEELKASRLRRPGARPRNRPQLNGQGGQSELSAGDRATSRRGRPDGFNRFGGRGGVRPGQAGLGRLATSALEIGKPFPSVRIVDADGKEFSTEQLKGHYTVLVAGCLTCPAFLRSYPGVETVHRDYASRGVNFYYVYRALAHPENNGIVKPFSIEERLMHVAEARERLATQIPWLADNMNNDFKRAIGNTNNSEFVLDPEGRIVHMQMWSNGARLRTALEEHVGPVEKRTTVADLALPSIRMQPNTRGTVVRRIDVPGIMAPLKIEPRHNGQPFYVKLRAEAEQSVLENGRGKLYLGFHIDPIHNTHWNNLVDPLHFDIKAPSGTNVTPASGDGPKLDVESDSDPREFLVSLDNADSEATLSLTVRYFACSDDPAWCKRVEQEYSIHLARDEFGGAVFGRTFRPPGFGDDFGGGPGPDRRPGFGPAGFGPPGFRGPPPFGGPGRGSRGAGPPGGFSVERLFRFDRNSDGKVSKAELPEFLAERLLGRADTNKDGVIDKEEAEGLGQERRGPDGRSQ